MEIKLEELSIKSFLSKATYPAFNQFYGLTKDDLIEISYQKLSSTNKNGKLYIAEDNGHIIAIIAFKSLDWDTNHFGFKCGIIDQYYYDSALSIQALKEYCKPLIIELITDAEKGDFKFISCSVNSWHTFLSEPLQDTGFNYILSWLDGVLKPEKYIERIYPDHEICPVSKDELPFYIKLAEEQYFDGGRFFLDSKFDDSKVREMYSALVKSSFTSGEIMLSYRISGEPAGLFISKKVQIFGKDRFRVAALRFLVIRKDIRMKNIGKDLFAGTLNYLSNKSDLITTGLEIHNLPSLNLHSGLGFKFNNTHNVFHRWSK